MYSTKRSNRWVRNRLLENQGNLLPSESFVLTMFFVEKVVRRVLLQLVISTGYPTDNAKEILDNIRGLHALKDQWERYDPQFRPLNQIIGNETWQVIAESATLRNGLIHGAEHRSQKVYRQQAEELIDALREIRSVFTNEYGYAGWKGLQDRTTSSLHSDPKVTHQGATQGH